MKEIAGRKYMGLALFAVTGFCFEFILAFMLEPPVFGISINDYSTPQCIAHWIATCIVWGIVGWYLIATAKNKYNFNVLKKGNCLVWWQWAIIAICIAASVCISYHNWSGFKVIREFMNLGLLKFIFQYIYYFFETMLITLILIFSQKAFEKWFHRVYIPYGGILLALTWGIGHFVSKDILTGILCLIVSFTYGSIYLLSNRDAWKTYVFVSMMFIL